MNLEYSGFKFTQSLFAGKLLNGRQHLLEFKPVGDHRTPGGGDFRIRSAVLWLKVEHLKQARDSHQREGGNHDGGGGARNITIWVFNMKTPGWESKVDGDCPLNYASAAKTVNGEKVDRNCPTSEGFSSNYESVRNGRLEDEDGAGSLELNLNEKVSGGRERGFILGLQRNNREGGGGIAK